MRKMMMLLGVAGLLGGCGDSKSSFEEGFDTKFHASFVESCTTSAVKSGAAQDVAARVCTCASDKVKERFSAREKMTLKNEQLMPIVQECAATVTPDAGKTPEQNLAS